MPHVSDFTASQWPFELILDWETVYIMSGTTGHTPTKIALTRF